MRVFKSTVAFVTHHGYPHPLSYDDATMGAVLPRCTGKLLASTERHPLNGMLALRGPLSRDPLRAFGTSLAFVTHHGYPQPLPYDDTMMNRGYPQPLRQ